MSDRNLTRGVWVGRMSADLTNTSWRLRGCCEKALSSSAANPGTKKETMKNYSKQQQDSA